MINPVRAAGIILFASLFLGACQGAPTRDQANLVSDERALLLTFVQGIDNEAGLIDSFSDRYRGNHYGATLTTRHLIRQIEKDYVIREMDGWPIDVLNVYCGLFVIGPDAEPEALLSRLRRDSRVESAQPVHTYHTRSAVQYDDPYFRLQTGVAGPVLQRLHGWSTGRGVEVAIIDTGIDAGHPDLRAQISGTHTFLAENDDDIPEIHGTAMAGIIAAAANNGFGIVGIAPDARILGLKACRQTNSHSSLARCDSFSVAKALSYAVDKRSDIINMSLSGPYDPLVERLVHAALEQNQVVVAADPGSGEERYPAMLRGVLAAAERQSGDEAAGTAAANPAMVMTPRLEVLSTGPDSGYEFFSGSSVSSAIVSGLTALLRQKHAEFDVDQHLAWLNQVISSQDSPAMAEHRCATGTGCRSRALAGAWQPARHRPWE